MDPISEPDVEAAWSAEIERRILEIDAGTVELIPWEDSLRIVRRQLTPADRARLVERLIATLDSDPEVEEAWATEVERRQTEIENGTVTLLPGPETLAKLKAEFE